MKKLLRLLETNARKHLNLSISEKTAVGLSETTIRTPV